MARVFVLVEDESGRQTGRGGSFAGVLGYVLRDAGPEHWRGSFGLMLPLDRSAEEMDHTYAALHLGGYRRGPKTKRPVLHAVLGWHASDLEWLTRDHLARSVQDALRHLGLAEHQTVWVAHTDTGRPHVHLVVNLVHPETGNVARLGLVKKRMSAHCAAYEQTLGDIRCKRRFEPKAANENRRRLTRAGKGAHKQKASMSLAPR
ncbi:MAG: relaxase/mobilization nuclease domain-containing protein [Hyphomicrobiaceae bacterium]|nr:MAG: relaxase/mobilization nuclease domain-containing protein [Hyphomicrobiaceae bacterium]